MSATMEDFKEYTIEEVAKILRVSDDTVRRRIKAKLLHMTRREGQEIRISEQELKRYIKATEPK